MPPAQHPPQPSRGGAEHMEAGVRAAARRRNWEGFGHGDDACGISSKEPGLQQACGGGRGAEGRRERLGGARRGGGDIALCAPPPLALLVGSLAVCDALVLPGFRLGGVGGHGAAWASAGRMFSPQQHCCLPRSIPTCSRRRGLSPRMCTDPIEIGGSWSSEGHDKHAMLPKWWTGEAVAAFLKKSPQVEKFWEEELAELESSIGYDPDQVPPPSHSTPTFHLSQLPPLRARAFSQLGAREHSPATYCRGSAS
ncbi:hypothetical protein T484DRAFT_3343218 [Baffinella frigidus]|nr:hypothetical protein T484DRAFT_3343218 [Cryptophyta sp. CCMP2293]